MPGKQKGFSIRDNALVSALDAWLVAERERYPGRSISRESLAREALFKVIPRRFHPRLVNQSDSK